MRDNPGGLLTPDTSNEPENLNSSKASARTFTEEEINLLLEPPWLFREGLNTLIRYFSVVALINAGIGTEKIEKFSIPNSFKVLYSFRGEAGFIAFLA